MSIKIELDVLAALLKEINVSMTTKIKTNSNQDQQKLVTRIFTGLLLVAIGSFFVFSSSWMLLLSLVAISIFICYECHHIVFQSPKNEKKQGFKNNKTIKHFISFLICLFLPSTSVIIRKQFFPLVL